MFGISKFNILDIAIPRIADVDIRNEELVYSNFQHQISCSFSIL